MKYEVVISYHVLHILDSYFIIQTEYFKFHFYFHLSTFYIAELYYVKKWVLTFEMWRVKYDVHTNFNTVSGSTIH